MKKLNFSQLEGWPASTETWRYFQEMIEQVQALSFLGGNNYIVSGCIENGNNVTSGWIVLNGEILPFEGGLKQDTIVAVQTETVKEFFGGALLPYYLNRKAIFGSGDGAVQWAAMKRNNPANSVLQRIERLEQVAAPFFNRGGMVLWKQPAILIPSGWQEVTDWRGRLPMGYNPDDADFNDIGKTGGSKSHVLQIPNMPAHNHANGVYNQLLKRSNFGEGNTPSGVDANNSGTEPTITVTAQIQYQGNHEPVDHMNPFRTVMFIEYIGE